MLGSKKQVLFIVGLQLVATLAAALPTVEWEKKTSAPIIGSPIVNSGVVYFGGLDSNFYALNAASGVQYWSIKTGGDIRSTPLVNENYIYFLSGDGLLYCTDKSGKIIWTFATKGEKKYELYSFADYFQSSPVYHNNKIFFGSGDSCIYAVNATTGVLVWKIKTGNIVHTRPCIYNGKVFIGSFDGWFYSLDEEDGHINWKFKSVGQQYFPLGEFNGAANAFKGIIYVGARDFNFYAIDAENGYCRWNARFNKGWAITTPLIEDSVLYIGTSDDHLFLALDPMSGEALWKFDAKYNIFGAALQVDSVIYFGTMMGHLYGVNKRNGRVVSDFTTDGYKAHRAAYFKDDDSYRDDIFSGIIKKNEDFLDLYIAMGAVISQPTFYQNRLICTSMDGTIYCLKI
jgi:outer membrane protein assembly factor BamB